VAGATPKREGLVEAYRLAYRQACARLRGSDLEAVARAGGAALHGPRLRVAFFGAPVEIHLPPAGAGAELPFVPSELPLMEKILVLHYLLGALGAEGAARAVTTAEPPRERGRLASFKNLPGAAFYGVPFDKRGPRRIARRFGYDLPAFERACRSLGWRRGDLGDASFEAEVFPLLTAVVVLHRGDEEFPPEAGILFTENVARLLPLEDVAVLGGSIATRLDRAARS
jgi:hypothetical protein